ncbi:MAG: hypothetical protein KIT00_01180, partial [Rhodospirillales bacterium]|nr:hypothetical protein [Rhodospirillales bacterium]
MSWNRLLASLVFYPKVGLAIFKAGRKGKRNQLNPTAIAAFGAEVKRGLESVGVRFEVTGLEHLVHKGPVVYIS